ncbi:glycosyltransferase family 4 protein [Alcaligenaceae bacterium LF4-65]|uniref:Glycosyltransferase family 4 protein n=1 Tax=Zwartia hollandica TaxID=324606 RepID=A0A953N728_9BURK|nr:glycosyltransferase family 4 protein [Zwartia hollandica]MBZ1350111.1 glycosyltransferase family 4 protein [Zwartia hollandica]
MKVLVFSQYFWPESFRINEVAESLQAVGCEVTVLTGQPNYPHGKTFEGYRASQISQEMHAKGYIIHRVPLIPRGKAKAVGLFFNYLSFVLSSALIGPFVLRGQKFDLIFVCGMSPFTQSVSAIWLGKLKKAKVVVWVQDLWPESLEATGFVKNKTVLSAVAAVVSWIYRHSDLLLVQSKGFISSVQNKAGSTPIKYHPNPGELAFNHTASDTRHASAVSFNNGFNIVFAGNLGTVQALDTVLDAAEQIKEHADINIVLIGSGSLTTWLESEIRRRNLRNVSMPGRFPVEAMPSILGQASALLVSLCRDPIISKTIPSKIQVYLAAGKPIIASLDGEGARVVEESGAGIGCSAGNSTALAHAILKLHALPTNELELMGRKGIEYYQQHFEPAMLARRLREYFSTLLASDPSFTAKDVKF